MRFLPLLLQVFVSVAAGLASDPRMAPADEGRHLTRGNETAHQYGVHEIALVFKFDPALAEATLRDTSDIGQIEADLTFTAPSGKMFRVPMFFDGGHIYRGRTYVNEPGRWTWTSHSRMAAPLNGQSGEFQAVASTLRGRLLVHPRNPAHWMTENGRWFLNLNDTAYFLLMDHDLLQDSVTFEQCQQYVRDVARMGLTSVRSTMIETCNGDWSNMFEPGPPQRLKLRALQTADQRLEWMLNHHPDIYVQLILFPLEEYGRDDTFWVRLDPETRTRLLREIVARFAAYPQVFWLFLNDAHYTDQTPNNHALVREVGTYLQQHDPWQHPRSTGSRRFQDFYYSAEDWCTYIHIEDEYAFAAAQMEKYRRFKKPVFFGEDRYEQDHAEARDPEDMPYFQRRLFWSWLLSGGSANYGGRWFCVHPYSQTGERSAFISLRTLTFRRELQGLDSVVPIRPYFESRQIELCDYTPADELVTNLSAGQSGSADICKACRRDNDHLLVYHPHARGQRQQATVEPDTAARCSVDLRGSTRSYEVEWFRCEDGHTQPAGTVSGGEILEFTAPWQGADVVLSLRAVGIPGAN